MMKRLAATDSATSEPPAGRVAIVADRGRLGPVIITGHDAQRMTFIRPDGTTQRGGPNRLFWLGSRHADGFSDLNAFFQDLGELAATIDLAALHGALTATNPAPAPLDAAAMAVLAGLEARPHADYALALAAFDDGLYFKVRDGRFAPESRADVEAAMARKAEQQHLERRVAAVVETFGAVLLGGTANIADATTSENGSLLHEALEELLQTAAFGRESPAARVTEAILASLQEKLLSVDAAHVLPSSCHPDAGPRLLSRQAEDLLIALGALGRAPNLAPIRAGVPRDFSPEVLVAAAAIAADPPSPPHVDVSALVTFAIDDADTTEVDDAIALDPTNPARVHVLIADAAAWVVAGSTLDVDARHRLTTLYLPDRRIPMLPPLIAEDRASLIAGAPRTALVISATIAADGHPFDVQIKRACVTVTHQMTYDDVEATLDGTTASTHAETLTTLEALATAHRRWRHHNGAVTFQRPEINFQLQADGHIELKVGAPLSRARQLVAEMMVLGCHVAAAFCAEREIPCLYRTQAAPDELPGPPDPVTGRIDDPVRQNDLMRKLKPSILTTDPRQHWTLGVSVYVQLTSPIRRYADLVVHQQLSHWLETGAPLFTKGQLEQLIVEITRTMANVRRADQESRRLFTLRWFEQEGDRVYDAIVLRDLGRRYLIDLSLIGWHESVHLRGKRRPGQTVRVRLESIDIENDSLHFREA